jgi:hypothetical protein
VLLAGQSASGSAVARALRGRYVDLEVIAESTKFYFRRARRLGRPVVAGQVLFMLLRNDWLTNRSTVSYHPNDKKVKKTYMR